ncbi:hypothetical protein CsSME_00037126 [Camellia sinensis var. sinensis]
MEDSVQSPAINLVPPESSNSQMNPLLVEPEPELEPKPPRPPKRKSESGGGRAPSTVWDHFDKVVGTDGKRRAVYWKKCRIFLRFLKLFYVATKKFSGSLFVTSNAFYKEMFVIENKINQLILE